MGGFNVGYMGVCPRRTGRNSAPVRGAGGRVSPPVAACGRVGGTEEHGCRRRHPDFDDGQLPVRQLGSWQGIGGHAGEDRAVRIGRSGLGDVGIAVADLPLAPGQRHYSGSFWSATERDLVIYESRLELARLLFADFDRSVQRILAQPLLLRGEVAGALRKHVPDYLLLTSTWPLVVDVKPRQHATTSAGVQGA